ncbi:MAG: hypothetical protein MJ148_03100 [Clostridia bacterium]|nr:hypothetical protein [Clostridia bacterium]
MERKRTRDIIISAVVAIILWFYLINIVNPQKDAIIRNVPVNISGQEVLEERGLAIAGDLKYTINISILGARNDVSQLSADDFNATADIASLNKGLDYIKVSVAAPRGIAIEDVDSDNIQVAVEDFVKEEKTVRLHFVDEQEGKETTVLKRSAEKLLVSGAKSDVDKVSFVLFDLPSELIAEDIPKSIILSGKPVDSNLDLVTGVEIAADKISVEAVIFTKKVVSLKTEMLGEPLYGELSIQNYDIPSVIELKGPKDVMDGLSFINAAPISIEGIDKTTVYTLEPQLPEGVYLTRDCPELKATIYIDQNVKETEWENTSEQTVSEEKQM